MNKNRIKKKIIFLLFFPFFVYSQNTGSLDGRILDNQNQIPLEGATVIIEGTSFGVITDENGYFNFQNIPTKSYNLTISFLGYKTKTIYNIILKSFGTPSIQVFLEEASDELEEIVLVQSPFKTTRETPLSTQTFSAVEIETYPGGNNDITKVVQSMPGISPSIGGFRNDIIIRGGAPNETVYYLDGIEIPNINHFSTQGSAGGPVGMLNVSFIREVTLSSSAFGAEYDNPLSGVLSFEQRNGNSKRLGGNFRFGATEAGITLEGPLFKNEKDNDAKTTFLFSVRRSYLQFLFELLDLPIRPDYWDYQWKVSHEIDQYNTLIFLGLGSVDDFSLKSPKVFDPNIQASIEQAPIIKQRSTTVGLSWKKKYKDGKGLMTTSISTNRLDNIFSRYIDNVSQTNVVFENDSYEWESKIRFNSIRYFDEWKTVFGANFQYSNYFNNTKNVLYDLNYNTEINFLKSGFYARGERSLLNNRIDLSIGFRFDSDTFSDGSSLFDNFSPRVSFSYKLRPDNSLKWNLSIGRYYKMPIYTILGYKDVNGNFLNRNTKYTRSDHYVSGFEYTPSISSKISLEGFYKKYSQYPVSLIDNVSLANKGGGFEVLGNEPISSDGKGKTYGLELLFQQKLNKNFYGIFAYTFFYSRFTSVEGEYLSSVWDSRHLISFSGGYKLKKNWEISARWRFSGKTPYVPVNMDATLVSYPEIILDYQKLGTLKLNTFNQADIRFDKKWNFKKLSFNLYFQIENFLIQPIPFPEEYGLKRNESGAVVEPISLVELEREDRGNTPIPSIGFVIDF